MTHAATAYDFAQRYEYSGKPLWIRAALDWSTFLGNDTSTYDVGIPFSAVTPPKDRQASPWPAVATSMWQARPAIPGVRPGARMAVARMRSQRSSIRTATSSGTRSSAAAGWEDGAGIALDSSGHAFVAGYSEDYWDSLERGYIGSIDTFVTELAVDGSLIQNTFLGGDREDLAEGIAVDANDHVLVSGFSEKEWGSPVRPFGGIPSIFVAQLTPLYSTLWMPLAAVD